MDKFTRIVDKGTGPIAEFYREGYIGDDHVFWCNKEFLLTRISNMEKDGRDTTEEQAALAAIKPTS